MTPTYAESERIRKRFLRDLANLEDRATMQMVIRYVEALDRIDADIIRALEAGTPTGVRVPDAFDGAEDTARIAILRGRADYIYEQLQRFGHDAEVAVRNTAPNAYKLGVGTASAQVKGLTGTFSRPSRRTVEQTLARLQAGTATADYFDKFAGDQSRAAMRTLTTGVILGENPKKIAARLRQTMDASKARLRTFARTEVMTAARAGLGDSYRENDDVIAGWIWNAEESATTCEVCWAMNGTLHDLDEDLDSHPNCRCVQTPTTKTFDEIIGFDTGIDETRSEAFDPDARFDAALDDAEKIKVLGPTKYALWRDGKIVLQDLVTKTQNPQWGPGLRATTIRELRERGIEGLPVIDRVAAAAKPPLTADRLRTDEGLLDLADELDLVSRRERFFPAQTVLSRLTDAFGLAGKPRVVDDDEMLAIARDNDHPVMWRGVGDVGDTRSTQMAGDFIDGDFFIGRGIYGNGTYSSTMRGTAESYAGSSATGSLLRFTLAKDARVIDTRAGERPAEFREWYDRTLQELIARNTESDVMDSILDFSTWAAREGYDAIRVQDAFNEGEDFYVILNRGKVIVSKKVRRPGE